MREPIIKSGEWLTHEDGRHYAQAKHDIQWTPTLMAKDFSLFEGTDPEPHSAIPQTVGFTGTLGVLVAVHVGDEWRPWTTNLPRTIALAQSCLDRSDEDWTFVDPEDVKTLARAVLGK